ncbi:glycoside hydrolase family 108 protein [Agrobacterium tumefaciens]|uniref:glycoside hydrolase family 108 protein n=1 Tax=Agrobacterium tumefaciens TaxID=358 RepID=UPI002AFE20F2|nr:glycoside hydrolase family 108 protein [Agrobacterium tumefaciens]MEA1840738.1 glycoside hydrolase family 108 protein [Agrobacterium tumefaciens]NTZ60022.1 glycoside hydrolase family 108 protein [Agrobacterium tumefaciens]
MARENLAVSLDLMFGHEGGYVNVKSDRGGPTKYGITHKTLAAARGVTSVTAAQVKAMTREEAVEIYRRSYWAQAGGDLLPSGLDYAAFDFGVNSGPQTAVKKLQAVLQAKKVYAGNIDGHIGEQTIAAMSAYPGGVKELIINYCEERMRYLRSLTNAKTGFPVNGRGWTIRVTGVDPLGKFKKQAGVVGNALKMVNSVTPLPTIAPVEAEAKAVVQDTGIAEVLKKPEAWGPLGGFLSAAGAIFAGAGPIQWALAILMIAGGIVGLVYFIQRIRSGG